MIALVRNNPVATNSAVVSTSGLPAVIPSSIAHLIWMGMAMSIAMDTSQQL